MSRPRVALVAGGGGLKSIAWHVGVIRALETEGFRRRLYNEAEPPSDQNVHDICIYIGSSGGAGLCAAAIFQSTVDEVARTFALLPGRPNEPQIKRRDLFRLAPLFRRNGGLFSTSGLATFIRRFAPHDDFGRLGPAFFISATPLNHRRQVIFGPRDSGHKGLYNNELAYYSDVSIADAVAASSSVPLLFAPYPIVNRRTGAVVEYFDGEGRDTVSVHLARDNQADLAIVSHIWVPYVFDAQHGSLARRGVFAVVSQFLAQAWEQKLETFRYDDERARATLEAVSSFCSYKKLSSEDTADLLEQLALTLNYEPCPRIEIAPDPNDAEFLLGPSMTFNRRWLTFYANRGEQAAKKAVQNWRNAGGRVVPLGGG